MGTLAVLVLRPQERKIPTAEEPETCRALISVRGALIKLVGMKHLDFDEQKDLSLTLIGADLYSLVQNKTLNVL